MSPLGGTERTRTYRCEGLTLRKASIGEADLVVTVFTADLGKVRAVGKGARRSSSKLVGHLEPLTLARLSMAKGRELDIVSQAEVLDGFASIKADLALMTRGLYVAELLDGFGSEDSPAPALYRLGINVLRALPGAAEEEMPLRYFEFHLLRLTGMLPELYHCVECRREVEPNAHRFSVNLGGVLCPGCSPAEAWARPLSLRAMKVLRLVHRRSLAEACALHLNPRLASEVKSILSGAVRYWLGKEVRSNLFLERLHNESTAGTAATTGE
jgi:DNA repair protein RecO (recombination protein O)